MNYLDCSSEEENSEEDESRRPSNDFQDLESFQKAHIKKKIKKRRGSRVNPDPETSPKRQQDSYREFVLHNKVIQMSTTIIELLTCWIKYILGALLERSVPSVSTGLWWARNPGVGQELSNRTSRKAGQFEGHYLCSLNLFNNASIIQVMQFGRIDGNAYTLDFQYPFCALQALAVALANVTQRLK